MILNLDAQDMVFSIMADLSHHPATFVCVSNIRYTLGLSFLGNAGAVLQSHQ